MLMATGNAGEATEVILQALESRPDDKTLGVLLFQAYAAQDRRDEAAVSYTHLTLPTSDLV